MARFFPAALTGDGVGGVISRLQSNISKEKKTKKSQLTHHLPLLPQQHACEQA
jgi:hypothetical protein